MKVTLQQYGGFAATIRRPPISVAAADLAPAAAAELAKLVHAAVAAPTPKETGSGRDAISYTITVEDGGKTHTLSQSDDAKSSAFAALLDWVQKRSSQ